MHVLWKKNIYKISVYYFLKKKKFCYTFFKKINSKIFKDERMSPE